MRWLGACAGVGNDTNSGRPRLRAFDKPSRSLFVGFHHGRADAVNNGAEGGGGVFIGDVLGDRKAVPP